MKITSTAIALLATAAVASAQIPSGSSGGPAINIAQNDFNAAPISLPPDGIIRCSTVTIGAGGRLRFTRNALNTPVYLLASGDVTINGIIDVDGETSDALHGGDPGPGGFAGGAPGIAGGAPGRGLGPGGGLPGINGNAANAAGGGTYSTQPPAPTVLSVNVSPGYGSRFPVPLVGGSGGGGAPERGGGGGGGAILIASSTTIRLNTSGAIRARGGLGNWNYGSGGSVRLLAFRVEGNGTIDVSGNGFGGWGRARVDLVDRSGFAVRFNSAPDAAVTVGGMTVAMPEEPRLELVHLSGPGVNNTPVSMPIPQGTPFEFLLPLNAAPNNTVTVRSVGFQTPVNVRVAVIPDSGQATFTTGSVPAQSTANIPINIPPNIPVRLQAWTE